MAVEILILSGTRQGARLVLDGKQFRVGTEPDCEVFFDPQQDSAARDRAALLQLEDDGWHIRSTGIGDLIVNQQVVAGSRCLRSGDVVRLSVMGPDFCFRQVTCGAELPKMSFDFAGIPNRSSPAVVRQPEAKPLEAVMVSPTVALASSPATTVSTTPTHWTKWVLTGLAVCLVMAFLWRVPQPQVTSPSPPPPPPIPQDAAQLVSQSVPNGSTETAGAPFTEVVTLKNTGTSIWCGGADGYTLNRSGTAQFGGASSYVAMDQDSVSPGNTGTFTLQLTAPATANTYAETWKMLSASSTEPRMAFGPTVTVSIVVPPPPLTQLRDTVFLLEVEKAGRFWPFATCVAVGKETLLTSAREAMQLAAWRDNEGFKVWAMNPALGIKKEVHEIRLHGVFATLAEKPNDWIYFNLALLGVEGDLPKVAPLATNEELAELKENAAVSCLGFAHEGKKTSAERQFKPESFHGSVFMAAAAKNLPGQPRLLQIEAKIPHNVYGSPILDEKGRVVGVYGAAALPDDQDAMPADAAMKDIHFATLVTPEAIRLWTEKRDEKMWVSPAALIAPSERSVNESDEVRRSQNGEQ